MFIFLGITTLLLNLYFLAITLWNYIYLKKITIETELPNNGKKISVLIPARDEEKNIKTCLTALAQQNYNSYEILVYNDHSTDKTDEIIDELIEKYPTLIHKIAHKPLPEGWKGKPFALQQMLKKATGEIVLTIDADMVPEKTLLSFTAKNMKHHNAECISGWPQHLLRKQKEALIVPLIYIATSFLFPLKYIMALRTSIFAHAIGQYMAFDKKALNAIGGFQCVSKKINEDVNIAREFKKAGYKQLFVDAKNQISGEMYDDLTMAFKGIERSIFDYLDNSLIKTIMLASFIFFSILFPFVAIIPAYMLSMPAFILLTLSIALFLGGWTLSLFSRKMPLFSALLYPLQYSLLMLIAIRSTVSGYTGRGYIWKGRKV